jgi:hypothetical protein
MSLELRVGSPVSPAPAEPRPIELWRANVLVEEEGAAGLSGPFLGSALPKSGGDGGTASLRLAEAGFKGR